MSGMDASAVMEARDNAIRKGNRHWRKGGSRSKDAIGNLSARHMRTAMDTDRAPDFGAIIPVDPTDDFPVDARKLHAALESKQHFTDWIGKRARALGFEISKDFSRIHQPMNEDGGRIVENYLLSLDMAKHLAMLERNDMGRKVRDYFIECEQRLREQPMDVSRITHLDTARALVAAIEERDQLAEQIEEQRPLVEFAEDVSHSCNTISMAEAAQRLQWGHYRLMARLRDQGILISRGERRNHPYQRFMDAGYLTVQTSTYETPDGQVHTRASPRVTGKGLEWLHRVLGESQLAHA